MTVLFLFLKVPCILLQVATFFVGGAMSLDRLHSRGDRITGAVVAVAAVLSIALIGLARGR